PETVLSYRGAHPAAVWWQWATTLAPSPQPARLWTAVLVALPSIITAPRPRPPASTWAPCRQPPCTNSHRKGCNRSPRRNGEPGVPSASSGQALARPTPQPAGQVRFRSPQLQPIAFSLKHWSNNPL